MAHPDILLSKLEPYQQHGIKAHQYAEIGQTVTDIAFRYRHIRIAYGIKTSAIPLSRQALDIKLYRQMAWGRQDDRGISSFALQQFSADYYLLHASYADETNPRTFVFMFGALDLVEGGVSRVVIKGKEDTSAEEVIKTGKDQGVLRKDETGTLRNPAKRIDKWTFSKALFSIMQKPQKA